MITKVRNNFGTSGLHGFGGNLKSREKKRMTVNEKYVCYHVLYNTVYIKENFLLLLSIFNVLLEQSAKRILRMALA